MTTYIGMDVHSKRSVFFAVDAKGRKLAAERVPTTETALLTFVKGIRGKKRLAVEACGMSRWVHSLLREEVDELVVCNPATVRRKKGAKTDFIDAEALAHGLRANDLDRVHLEDSALAELRTLMSGYKDVIQDLVRAKNRYKAILRGNALDSDGRAVYHDSAAMDGLARVHDRFVAEGLFRRIEDLEDLRDSYQSRLGEVAKRDPVIRRLMTIPGIREVRACQIASAVLSPERFADKHRLWSYAMLVRHPRTSDGVSYGSRRAFGRSDLKEAFMGAAETVLNSDGGLRSYYDNLRKEGIEHKKAKKALARKIAAIALKVMRSEVNYIDGFEEKERKRIAKARNS